MPKTDLTMKIKDAYGKSSTSKISYVNSDATNSQLAAFAGKLNAMTTNSLEEASRVSTTELSLAPKTQRTITMTPATATLSEIKQFTTDNSAFTFAPTIKDSEGQEILSDTAWQGMYIKSMTCKLPSCIRYDDYEGMTESYCALYVSYGDSWDNLGSKTGTITIALPEDETYGYAEATVTVTEG